ncbi:alpha-ketoglutarate-dependent dioxygenase alkB homolog 3 isoform X1 [Arvicola amphibius]|uniref:alpha-ketoglutarate-dependent dioxygenase alkB homolog 3 isoform X1 n=1 Tax=Arvicola amphibius TaxID=1047088 RepID=UPI0018E3769E|nr:alpha-ketoglutarate-dependent dioxygenase alkB homolog 3 isoform X1 [Arvicola amphibius]
MKSSEISEQKALCSIWTTKDGEPEYRERGLLRQLLLVGAIFPRHRGRPGGGSSCLTESLCSKSLSCREGVHEISLSPIGVSRVCLYPGFVDLKEADWILERLCRDVPWKQRMGIKEDRTYPQPRLTAWYGELPYTYSRITMEPNPHWHPVLCTLKSRIEENTGHTFNSLLCNLYRDEKDSVDWHSDDEPSLGSCPIIASLSFGATRTFEMRKKPPPEENGDYTYMERVKIPLDHGTLLIMEGATQADWQHRVPKEYHSREPRVNLTFRTIYPDPRGAPGDGTCPQSCH